MTDSPSAPVVLPATGRRSALWLWFVAGFLLVLVGMSFLPMGYYDGRAVYQTSLWRYYLLELRLAWNSTGALGPTSGSSAHALSMAFQHLLFSVVGGIVMAGIGWVARKFSRKQ